MKGVLPERVSIVGAAAISGHGTDWRGLARAVRERAVGLKTSEQLRRSHPDTRASEVRAIPEGRTAAERRARMLMSRSAVLSTLACEAALRDAGFADGVADAERDTGFYLGVGASGGATEQLEAMLEQSVEGARLSLDRFGDAGLRACNPMFAFQLMNNFTLCHAAILQGTQGPNGAFFSRGAGTMMALSEAAYAIIEGDCCRALAGGADSCLHSVTWAELLREGWVDQGLVAGEGAALLVLEGNALLEQELAVLECCATEPSRDDAGEQLSALKPLLCEWPVDAVVVAPWGHPPREALTSFVAETLPSVPLIDMTSELGEALAATPALAWVVGLDLVQTEECRRVVVLSAGLDGALGLVVLGRGGVQ